MINLPGIVDEKFKKETLKEAKKLRAEVVKHTEETVRMTEKAIFDEG